jgi:hypothetical protein
MSSIHHKEEAMNLFHIKIQIKKNNVNASFDYGSHTNLIAEDLVRNLGLEMHDHLDLYPLRWLIKDVELKVTKHCNPKFSK